MGGKAHVLQPSSVRACDLCLEKSWVPYRSGGLGTSLRLHNGRAQ